jgi:hypothetical protein
MCWHRPSFAGDERPATHTIAYFPSHANLIQETGAQSRLETTDGRRWTQIPESRAVRLPGRSQAKAGPRLPSAPGRRRTGISPPSAAKASSFAGPSADRTEDRRIAWISRMKPRE